jgi:hypothetical protein
LFIYGLHTGVGISKTNFISDIWERGTGTILNSALSNVVMWCSGVVTQAEVETEINI